MPLLSPIISLLLQAFIKVSEKWILDWYDKAKDREVKHVQTQINSDPDPVIADKLRKWERKD